MPNTLTSPLPWAQGKQAGAANQLSLLQTLVQQLLGEKQLDSQERQFLTKLAQDNMQFKKQLAAQREAQKKAQMNSYMQMGIGAALSAATLGTMAGLMGGGGALGGLSTTGADLSGMGFGPGATSLAPFSAEPAGWTSLTPLTAP